MAYKSKAMQEWAGKNQPSSANNTTNNTANSGYKSVAMQKYEAEMAKRAEEQARQAELEAQLQAEAETPRKATLKDLTLGSVGRGYATSKYGNEHYDEIMLGTNRQAKQAQKAKEKTEQEKYNFAAQSKAGRAISGAGELIGQQIYNFTNRDTLGAIGANVAGAAAVGAAVPLPEEIVTIPTAVARGLKLGTAATMYQISAAQAYDEMIEAGVSEKTAKTVANVIGAGMGALEGIQADELLKSAKILKGVKGEASEKALANIMKALGKLGVSTALETGEEVAQEAVSMLGQDYAKAKEGIKTFTPEEYGQRLKDTAVQSALSFGVLGGIGAVGGAVANRNNVTAKANDVKSVENEAKSVENSTENKEASTEMPKTVENQRDLSNNVEITDGNGTKSSKIVPNKLKNNEPEADIKRKRYGEEGKKLFKTVKNDPQKLAEFDTYYREGVMGKEMPAVEGVLNETEATSAYNAGKVDGEANRTAYAQKQYVVSEKAGLNKESAANLPLGDRIVYNTIGKAFGKEVVVVPTIKNADGTQSNAKIDLANGIIYIAQDAHKGAAGGGRIALAHEVVHDMRVAAPAEFDNLARLVTDYHKRFSKYDSKFADTAKLYELDKGKIDYYDMMEEMVADFIADNNGAERIVDMLSTDKPLAQKFIDSVKKVVVKLGKLALDKETRKIVNEWEDLVKQLEATVKATEEKAKKYTVEQTNAEGDVLTIKDKETGDVRHNLWSYNNGGRQVLMNTLAKQKFPEADVKRAADIMGEMATMMENFAEKYANILDWNNTEVLYDQNGRTYYSAMVKNGDYKINIDLSTICKKRIALQNVLNKLVKQNLINDVSLSPENIATINKILKENGYETQCPACFVESKRYNIEKWANDFANKWNNALDKAGFTANGTFDFSHGAESDHMDAMAMLTDDLSKADEMLANIGTPKRDENGNILYNKKGKPQMYKPNTEQKIVMLLRDNSQLRKRFTAQDLIGTEGIRSIKTQYPDIYSLILTQWGVATPKIVQTTIPYNNEVAVYKDIAKKSKYIGGVRMFSFSDFTIDQVFDYVQIVADLYAQKAMMHTYTKEITFAKLFGTTGIKINLSFIPAINKALGKENAGLGANGELIYSEWGVDPKEAKALMSDKRYSANLTPIMIGVGDKHIWKLLDTDDIRYIIPYHKSSLNPVVAKMTDIEYYEDYSDFQTTRHADGSQLTKAENNKFDFYKTLEKTKDARATADAYLKWCDDNGYIPKFEQFREHKNYYKLLVDFNLYDAVTGEFVPQKAVTMEFPAEFSDIVGEELAKQKGLSDKLGIKEDQTFKQIVNTIKKPDVRESKMSANKKITVGMTDSERTDILKTKSIVAEVYKGQADDIIEKEKHNLESNKLSLIQKTLLQIGKQFGVDTDYDIKDVELKVNYSKRNLQESIDKALDATQMAKLMPIFKNAVESSIGIESHSNRYFYDIDTTRFDNLVGGYVDGNNFIPIRFGLKHRKNGKVVLYVVVDNEKIPLNKIKAELSVNTDVQNVRKESTGSAYNISIKDIAPFVNGKDLLRYIPDNMLDEKQTKLKWEAIAETVEKTNNKNDKYYTKYLGNGKLTNAYSMVKSAAKYYGYTIEAWHGTRQTFNSFSKDKLGSNTRTEASKKWFFAGDKDTANSYYPYGVIKELQGVEAADKMREDLKGNLYHLFIKMENPLVVDVAGYDYAAHKEKADAFMEYVEQAEKNGNDGIILYHVRDNQLKPSAEESTIYMFKNPSQAKSADVITYNDNDEIIPISKRFDETVEDMRHSKMSEPDIPEGYKERGFAESTRTKSTQADKVKQDFIDNPDFYKQLANKTTREKAEAILAKGLSFAEAEFPKLLERMDAVAVPLADMMAKEYSKMGEHDKASNVIREAGQRLTKAGQFSQAAAIMLLKHNPMAALAYAQRDIDKLNVDGKKRFGSKWKDFELTDAETEMFKNIKEGDAEGIKKAYETINKRLAKEYPSTIWQKFIEASRISMLLNPRTNVKNVVSNLLLYPVTRGSGILSSKLQKAYSYYNKDYKPNQSGLLKKEIRTQAEKVWDDIKDTLETTNKYNEGIKANGRDIQVFKEGIGTRVIENIAPGTLHKLNTLMGKEDAGLMETMRNATYWFLEVGDNIFVKQNFISRFGSYMQAKGITDINSMSEEDMAAAIEVAYREALRATFKDDTALSKWLANIKHTGNPYIDALMEMVMPFTKTPANIAMRGIDYSPVGIINTINKARKSADASEVIDGLSKNLLGSALIAFGAWLFSKGIVTGGEPENEKQAAFLKQQGWLPYAVKMGDRYVTYDWAQPAAIPVIMGVTMMESLEEGRLGVVDAVKNAGVASFNQWIELSPLQSLQEVMGGYGTVGENLLNTAIEMPQRLIPSALGATARTADTTQRVTYSKGNVAQTQKDIAKSKIPGASQTLPVAYDTWGNAKQRDDSTLGAALNQYINPSSTKLRKQSEVDLEIDRLYESLGDEAVYPRKADYTIKKDGTTYQLDNKEYSEYQRIMGELSYDSVRALMDNEAYDSLTDYEKGKIIEKIYSNAFETAKYAILEGKGYKKTSADVKDMQETKIKKAYMDYNANNIAEYYIAHQILNNAESDKTKSGVTIAGSKKKNGINRLVELGYTRSEAKRLYERMNGG